MPGEFPVLVIGRDQQQVRDHLLPALICILDKPCVRFMVGPGPNIQIEDGEILLRSLSWLNRNGATGCLYKEVFFDHFATESPAES